MPTVTEAAEILAAPYTCYLAPVGTAFPAVTAAPGVEWTKIGKLGNKNYADAGVTVTTNQTVESFRGAGSTWQRKAWRNGEDFEVSFDLADLTIEQWALLLDNVTVTKSVGAKTQSFNFNRGFKVHDYALLLKGVSPLNGEKEAQFQVPACYQAANQAPKMTAKGGPALLSLQFTAIEVEEGKTPELVASE